MAMSRIPRKTTLRAPALWRTICAERSSVSPTACARGPAEKRSTSRRSPDGVGVTAEVPGSTIIWLARRELASPRLVAHMQPVGDLAGMRPGCPSATGSGPRMTRLVSTMRSPSEMVWGNRSRLRGAGPSCWTFVPSRS